MQYQELYQFIADRLGPVVLRGKASSTAVESGEDHLTVDPIPCQSIQELYDHYFSPKTLEHSPEIEHTLNAMLTVILSTSATGGQLALRVMGEPGTAKSTLAESMSVCNEMVHPMSKFTGIISGWSSIKKSKLLASKINGKTLLIKDADTLLQLPNLSQVESELRDALGDGVIRSDYRTGRSFEIYTLFTLILCGTPILRQMDNARLGARYLDINIRNRNASTDKIVRRAIKSQFRELCSQLSEGIGEVEQDKVKRKEIIRRLAPPTYGFLLHKRQQIREGIEVVSPGEKQEEIIRSMGEVVSYLRAKVDRDNSGDLRQKAYREAATRLGEQFTRFLVFNAIIGQEPKRGKLKVEITDREHGLAKKIMLDSTEGYGQDIARVLYKNGGETRDVLAAEIGLSPSHTHSLLQDMLELGTVRYDKTSNPHGSRGRNVNLYRLNPELASMLKTVDFE